MSRIPTLIRNSPQRLSKEDVGACILITVSFIFSLCWIFYTGYIEEDAFITFRFARQIAAGNGFVYNNGEPIYGTTTPLLTLLLAGWLKYFSTDIVLGARILNVFASAGTLFFTWRTLNLHRRPASEVLFALAAIVFSSKMLYMSTQGMEMPLVTCLMAASWYTYTIGKLKWTGFLCGLLLWARVDLLFWPAVLSLATGMQSLKKGTRVALFTGLTYLPWTIFAAANFGSLVPHTVTAKWVAYSQFNQTPFLSHLGTILEYLSPFYLLGEDLFPGSLIVLLVIAWALWRGRLAREKIYLVLIAFILVEAARLTLTRATFFNWYFIPLLWASLVLFGTGLGMLWDISRNVWKLRYLFGAFLTLTLFTIIGSGSVFARTTQAKQTYRYDRSLKAIGLWLGQHSDPQSTVLLEPLGYVGFYSERRMLDEVGLVTPEVVELKIQGIPSPRYALIFQPDYAILHCDDALRMQAEPETRLAEEYRFVQEFNPLGFDPAAPSQPSDPDGLRRSSCYQIWQRKGQP